MSRKVSIEIPKTAREVDADEAQEMAPEPAPVGEPGPAVPVGPVDGSDGEDEQADASVELSTRPVTKEDTGTELPVVGPQSNPDARPAEQVMTHASGHKIVRTESTNPVELRPIVPPYTFPDKPKTVTQTANGITRGDF